MAAAITGRLALEATDQTRGGRMVYRTLYAFSFRSDVHGWISVPAGFETDCASIPWPANLFIHPETPAMVWGGVVHDLLYATGGQIGDRRRRLTRREADQLLVEVMELMGARAWQQRAVYWVVRLAGRRYWGRGHLVP